MVYKVGYKPINITFGVATADFPGPRATIRTCLSAGGVDVTRNWQKIRIYMVLNHMKYRDLPWIYHDLPVNQTRLVGKSPIEFHDFPMKTNAFHVFSIAMFHYRRVETSYSKG